jgi:hypothetical protein
MIPKSKDASNAFMAAVAAGATVCAVQFLLMTGGFAGAGAPVSTVLWAGLALFLITWFVAAFGFVMGLMLIGIPVWAGLSRLGWMSPASAVASGAILSTLVAGGASFFTSDLAGSLVPAAFLLLPGAAAGFALHRMAYGKGSSRS